MKADSSTPVSKQFRELTAFYSSDHRAPKLVLLTAGLTTVVGLTSLFTVSRAIQSFRRIPNVDWVHPGILAKRPLLRGVVTRYSSKQLDSMQPFNSLSLG